MGVKKKEFTVDNKTQLSRTESGARRYLEEYQCVFCYPLEDAERGSRSSTLHESGTGRRSSRAELKTENRRVFFIFPPSLFESNLENRGVGFSKFV